MRRVLLSWTTLAGGTLLVALAGGLAFAGPVLGAAEVGDAVEVRSVATYLARSIETGETVGRFLQVRARVRMAEETRAQLHLARDVPRVLSARLQADGGWILPCGAGGILPSPLAMLSQSAPEGGEPISPLFYLPAGTAPGALELVVGIDRGGGPIEPVARSPLSSAEGLESLANAVRIGRVGEKIEERPDFESLGGTREMKTVRLQLPAGFTRILSRGTAELYRGEELAEDLSLELASDVVAARFPPEAELGTGPWELHFPALGVKLLLDVTGGD